MADAPALVYSDSLATLWHGDCREATTWLEADVLVTDPPYGIGWKQRNLKGDAHPGIVGDTDTTARDEALALWGPDRPAILFGSLSLGPPTGTKQVLIWRKPPGAGHRGTTAGYRRDCEAIYLVGPWPSGIGGRSSVLVSAAASAGNPYSPAGRTGHPHTKPVDLMATLIGLAPGTVADPFAGSGSALVAAKQLGRRAIGVEIEERYCRVAASRLAQKSIFESDDG